MISAISNFTGRLAQRMVDRFLRTFVQEHEDLMRMHEELDRREQLEKQGPKKSSR